MLALAGHAPDLAAVLRDAGAERRMILDGPLSPTQRCASRPSGYAGKNQDPYYGGKHHPPGVNLQALNGAGRRASVCRRSALSLETHILKGSGEMPTASSSGRSCTCGTLSEGHRTWTYLKLPTLDLSG